MRPEDLFAAIGSVEESRLARSDIQRTPAAEQEDKRMNRKSARTLRNLLVAAVIVSMLAVSAYAVTGFFIYENPEQMVNALFGDNTGFDHKEVTTWSDPQKPGSSYQNPGYDRVPVDETVAEEDVVPHVEPVGQTVSGSGYTLTVDAFLYDAATGCGFVTYQLKNPHGHDYRLQNNGEVWYEGRPNPVGVNVYGYHYIIQEKTTFDCLTATYYFRNTGMQGENIVLSLPCQEEMPTVEQISAIIEDLDIRIRQQLTPEEAVRTAKETLGEAIFEGSAGVPDGLEMTQEEWDAERAYTILRDLWYQNAYEQKGPSITIPMAGSELNHATAAGGAVVISPISFQLDGTDLKETLPEVWRDDMVDVGDLTICFKDGTEYVVLDPMEACVDNTIFRLVDSATEGREDLYNRYTCMFNRIIDVDSIVSITVEGETLPAD